MGAFRLREFEALIVENLTLPGAAGIGGRREGDLVGRVRVPEGVLAYATHRQYPLSRSAELP